MHEIAACSRAAMAMVVVAVEASMPHGGRCGGHSVPAIQLCRHGDPVDAALGGDERRPAYGDRDGRTSFGGRFGGGGR